MNIELPPTIAAFFRAHNTGQTEGFNELFTNDAFVNDEEQDYRGPAVKGWIDGAIAKYKPIAEPTDIAQAGEGITVTAQVSGNFPGSPAELRYNFTLKNGKIAALVISA
jgi:hypothetical protein